MTPTPIVIQDFISPEEEADLLKWLLDSCQKKWNGRGIEPNGELLRRTMQFGQLFRYKTRKFDPNQYYPWPKELEYLVSRLEAMGHVAEEINHCVVNEYDLGQG